MSARRRDSRRAESVDLSRAWSVLRWRAIALRDEWLAHALRAEPADRAAAEDAIAGLYALLGRAAPEFVWLPSPGAAVDAAPGTPALRVDGPLPFESRLANLVADLRRRLDREVGELDVRVRFDEPGPIALDRELRAAIDTTVAVPLRRSVLDSLAATLRAEVGGPLGLTWRGQHDAWWVARHEAHLLIPGAGRAADVEQLALWARVARSCGWWWPRDGVCLVAERPVLVRVETVSGGGPPPRDDGLVGVDPGDVVRPHRADGPAIVFADGWSAHAWHGTRVPAWVIEEPTVERIAAEPDVEVRRCAIERIGWEAFVDQAGLALVGRAPDPGNPGCELRLYAMPRRWGDGLAGGLLLAVNGSVERDGTRRRYGLRVPGEITDPLDAAGWSYGVSGRRYAQLARRT